VPVFFAGKFSKDGQPENSLTNIRLRNLKDCFTDCPGVFGMEKYFLKYS
jgi:hypothetical protein